MLQNQLKPYSAGLCVVLSLLACLPVGAQTAPAPSPSATELFLGYSYLRFNGQPLGFAGSTGLNGGEVGANFPLLKPWLGLDVDMSGNYGSDLGVTVHSYDLLAGPQAWYGKGKFRAFGRVLVGAAHDSISVLGTSNHFAYGAGGGVEANVHGHIAVRFLQADYIRAHGFGARQNNVRLSAGIVFRWGH